jgi:molecular chaperone GrpE
MKETEMENAQTSTDSQAMGNASANQSETHDANSVTQEQWQRLQEELNKWKNDYLYLRAEFDNYRKHVIKERSDLQKYGAERFVRDLLEVVDNFDRAVAVTPKADGLSNYVAGVQMIAKELKSLLQKHAVVAEECLHQPFDPSRHEAIGSEVTTEVQPGHITKVVKSAYWYHDKLLRPAQVMVAMAPNNSSSQSQ